MDKLESMDKTLLRNTITLEEHQRRSEVNEKAIELTREVNEKAIELLATKLGPLQAHVTFVHNAFKLLGILAAVAGVVDVILHAIWKG